MNVVFMIGHNRQCHACMLNATTTQIISTTCIPDEALAHTFEAALHWLPPSPHFANCCNCRQQLMHARIYSTVYVYNQFFDPVLMELQGRIAAAEIVFSARGLFSSILCGAKLIITGFQRNLEKIIKFIFSTKPL